LKRGIWQTDGKTPEATISARLSVDIKHNKNLSRFRRVGPGVYALNTARSNQYDTTAALIDGDEPIPSSEDRRLMSFTDAAAEVLERNGSHHGLHYREITKRALESGLIVTEGKTPEATMSAQIYTEIERQNRRGERPRFVKLGRGTIGLSRWMGSGLAFQIEQHNRSVHQKLLDQVRSMDPIEFESLVSRVLTAIGFDNVSITNASGDSGIDVRGVLVVGEVIRTRMAVQVKRWRNNVQAPIVQQVRGSLGTHEQGLIITTSNFSSGAGKEAVRPNATPIALMNGQQFVNLMVEHDIGIHRSSHDIIELGEPEPEA
jgi:restriction system protein